jgi:uncharacterized protein (DUF433 family)
MSTPEATSTAPAPVPETADLSKYIERRLFGERPHIRDKRIWVSMITANYYANHWTVAETAYQFTLSEEEVLAAILYYREHKDEIDAQDEEENRLWEEMAQKHKPQL